MSGAGPNSLLSLPNLLSLSRLPLGGLFWVTLGPTTTRAFLALGVMALAAATDVLDGAVARKRGLATAGTGAWLDPFCDKMFVGAILATLLFKQGVPLTTIALIITRELLQLPLVLVYQFVPSLRHWLRYDFRASVLGKAATVTQFIAIAMLILGWPARPFAWAAFALGITALADYVRRAIAIGRQRLLREPEAPKKP